MCVKIAQPYSFNKWKNLTGFLGAVKGAKLSPVKDVTSMCMYGLLVKSEVRNWGTVEA